jgi:hypothetical protein
MKGKKALGLHDGPGAGYHAEPAAEVLGGNLAGVPATNLLSGLLPAGGLLQGGGGPLGGAPLTESGRAEGVQAGHDDGGSDETKRETPRPAHHRKGGHDGGRDVTMISNGNTGILNGTQVHAPIQVPIDVSGVAAAVLGQASAWSTGGSSARI